VSYVLAWPETMSAAATNVASIGSLVATADQGAADATTAVLAAAEDEVSAAIAALFSAHGQGYQALSAQAAAFHQGFVQALNNASGAYAAAEAASTSPLAAFEQELLQFPTNVANGFDRVGNLLFTTIFGAPAAPPIPAGQTLTFTGTPSLVTRFEEALLYPLKPLLSVSGLEPWLATPGNPLLAIFASDVPPISLFIGNSPPPFLNLLLGETVSYSTSNGMSIVQITPAHPTGEYVVAIHGGAFIFPPSFLHWIHYSVMSYQTGATIEVPIYPLIQQGGTAGLVVPQMTNFISSQVTQHGASNVSVIGDSAGGNLALAAVEQMAANPMMFGPVPSRMVLLSPWLDLGMTNPNIGFVQDPLLPVGLAQQFGKQWAGGLSITNPMVSPLYATPATLAALPPTTVYTGNLDILSPDAIALAGKAASNMSFVLANGQIHDWLILTLDGPQYWHQINQELGIAA
jgi:triacylglycerol lipase